MIAASPQSFLLGSGESGRAERLRRADRLRPGLGHLAHPGRQEPYECRRAHGQGQLCGQHQVQEPADNGRAAAAGRLADEGAGEEAAGSAGGSGGGEGPGSPGLAEEAGQPAQGLERFPGP